MDFNFGFDQPPVQMYKDKKEEEKKDDVIQPRKIPSEPKSPIAKNAPQEEPKSPIAKSAP